MGYRVWRNMDWKAYLKMIPLGENLRQMLGLSDPPAKRKRKRKAVRVVDMKAEDLLTPQPAVIPMRARSKKKPKHAERVEVETAISGKSYEEENWSKLSPEFRNAHNRLRQLRGLPTIPPPRVDLYVRPRTPVVKPMDMNAPDLKEAAMQFMRPVASMPRFGDEGFTINGEPADMNVRNAALRRTIYDSARQGPSEGFKINGKLI